MKKLGMKYFHIPVANAGPKDEQADEFLKVTDEVARATGLKEGDVILAINRTLITSARQVADVIESFGSRQAFRIYFERTGQMIFTDLVFR